MLRIALIVLSIATALPILSPEVAYALTRSPLGMLFGYFMNYAPVFLVFLVLGEIGRRLLTVSALLPVMAVIGLVGVVAILPYPVNMMLDRLARELVAGDQRTLVRPANVHILAVRGDVSSGCDEFCQRILLNGQVDRLLYAPTADVSARIDPDQIVQSFRMERRSKCPAADVETQYGMFKLADEKLRGDKKPADLMQLAIAGGNCLLVEQSTLDKADVILSRGRVSNPQTAPYDIALNFGVDILIGERLSLHVRDGGQFRETWRWTSVSVEKIGSIQLSNLRFNRPDWRSLFRHVNETYSEAPVWSVFVTDMFGLDLALHQTP